MKTTVITAIAGAIFGWIYGAAQSSIPRSDDQAKEATSPSRISNYPQEAENPGDRHAREILSLTNPHDQTAALVDLATSIPPHDIRRWLESDRLGKLEPEQLAMFQQILLERWIERAPHDAVEWSRVNQSQSHLDNLLCWARDDIAAAIDYIHRNGSDARQLSALIQDRYRSDPAGAIELFESNLAQIAHEARRFINLVAHDDFNAAIELCDRCPTHQRTVLYTAAAAVIGEQDFPAALAFLNDAGIGAEALTLMVGNYRDTRTFARQIREHHRSLPAGTIAKMYDDAMWSMIDDNEWFWLESTTETIDVDASTLEDLQRFSTRGRNLYEEDPQRMRKLLESGSFDDHIAYQLFRNLFRGQHEITAEQQQLIEGLSNPTRRKYAYEAFEHEQRPDVDVETPEQVVRSMAIENKLVTYASRSTTWTAAESQEAIGVFSTLSPQQQLTIYQDLTDDLPRARVSFPFIAAVLAIDHPSIEAGPEQRSKDIAILASRWAYEWPAEAAAWAETIPDPAQREAATQNIARQWQRYSPEEAERWTQSLEAD